MITRPQLTPIQVQFQLFSISICYKISNIIDTQPETHMLQSAAGLLQLVDILQQAGKIRNLRQVCGVSGCVLVMQCDVTCCVFCISNKVEYLDKDHSYKNSRKEVIL